MVIQGGIPWLARTARVLAYVGVDQKVARIVLGNHSAHPAPNRLAAGGLSMYGLARHNASVVCGRLRKPEVFRETING